MEGYRVGGGGGPPVITLQMNISLQHIRVVPMIQVRPGTSKNNDLESVVDEILRMMLEVSWDELIGADGTPKVTSADFTIASSSLQKALVKELDATI